MKENTAVDTFDLSGLPEHLHEWARNLEAEANRCQRAADQMGEQARLFGATFTTKSVLGENKNE